MEKLKKIIISAEMSIKDVLRQMDSAGEKTILVADRKNRLLGTVTDGDIRRWILKGRGLNNKVSKVMNKNPIFLRDNYSKEEARDLMISKAVECIPVINENRQIVSAIWWLGLFDNAFKKGRDINIPVVIMAGGEGSRLVPFTNILPKPLIPIRDKPVIELIMDKFTVFGCKEFYLSIRYKANIVKAYFKDSGHKYMIRYVEENEPLGTIGSLSLIRNKIKSTFIVSNCDILIDADYYDIVRFHRENKNIITLVVSLKHVTIPYGICEIKNGGILRTIKEKPEYDFLVNTGSYVMEPSVLRDIPRNKTYHATDLISYYIKNNKKIGVYPVSEKSWLDLGQWEEYQKMQNVFFPK